MTTKNPVSFMPDGSPFCEKFNDIYFDASAGYSQSQSIFIEGNHLANRLHSLTKTQTLTIIETGFGSGLNFLLTLKCFQETLLQNHNELTAANTARLHFISTEKFPLSKAQLASMLSIYPDLAPQVALLLAVYQDEFHQPLKVMLLDNQVCLEIHFQDSAQALSSLVKPKAGLADIWYLDGFSPEKNPAMWSDELFTQIARLSKQQASLATFTVAGFVKRALRRVGFRVEKQIFSGNKNEITCAIFQSPAHCGKGYQQRPTITKPQQVTIVGGGIASACAAYLLTKNGIKVKLYCKDNKVAQGASSNDIGALFPLLHQQQDEISLFYQQAFWSAKKMYQGLLDDGFDYSHDWCGLLEISYKHALSERQKNFEKINAWPKELIHSVNNIQASEKAGIPLPYGGLFMPNAGWIAPQELVQQLFNAASKTNRLKIETSLKVVGLTQLPADKNGQNSWKIHTDKTTVTTDVLVLSGGAESIKMDYLKQLPLSSVRGQISSMKSQGEISNLSTVICHKGYLTPQNKGVHCIGATFDKNTFDTQTRKEDDQYNLNMLAQCLPTLTNWGINDVFRSKARLRCMTPDHLPMVGPMPDIRQHITTYAHLAKDKNWKYNQPAPVIDNLYVMTGFGARGLCSAPLAAEILLADLTATPYPMANEALFNLAPNRFVIRDLIKRKYLNSE